MTTALRKTGIGVVGDMPWGTHFCHFYETKDDLLETVVAYFKAGLEDYEFCMWVVPEPLTEDEAWGALRHVLRDLDRHVSDRSIEMFRAREWYLKGGKFDLGRVTAAWNSKLDGALARGYAGMRVSGNSAWLDKKDWRDFCEYEEQLNGSITDQPMMVLCTYPLLTSGATERLDVARTHQFAIARRRGSWEVVETPQLRQAKAEITRLNAELERRVMERTAQLEAANDELRKVARERNRAEAELRALKDELGADLVAMARLYEFSMRLLASTELQPLLDEALGAIIALQGADFGNVQLYNPESQALEIVAHHGFPPDFLDYFSRVHEDSAACGRALRQGERVIIEDVETDPGFAPHRQIAASTGFRAVQSTPLFDRSGEVFGMVSTHFRRPHRPSERDLRLTDLYARQAAEIIERKRAEEALRQREAEFRLLTEAIPQHVWSLLPDGSLDYCNQRWVEYTGVALERGQREGWAAFIEPAEREATLKVWRKAFSQGIPYEAELRLRGVDGHYRRFVSRAVPFYDERGQLIRWFGTNTNVEARRRTAEALHQAQIELAHVTRLTTMGELTTSLAHELNQPLHAILANSQACLRWLDRDRPNLDETVSAVQRIIRDATRAGDVIAHTRALLRKTNGERVRLDVAEVIHEVLALVHREVLRHRIVIRESLAAATDLAPILGDRIQLQQVMLNLIMNGIEAMADVGDRNRELVIRAEPHEVDGNPGVLVTVRDAGIGVAPENLGRLFEPFYSTKRDGLGMGLSISRSLVQAHGGRLWATRNPGPGTTFQFILPAGSPPAA